MALESDALALLAHEVFSLSLFSRCRPMWLDLRYLYAKTPLEMQLAIPTEPGTQPWGEWISVCASRPTVGGNFSAYRLFDVNMGTRKCSHCHRTSVIDGRKQLAVSGNGRVFVTAMPMNRSKFISAGRRLLKHFEFQAWLVAWPNCFWKGGPQKPKALIDRLERYARSVRIHAGTRKLLDLQSPVIKRLAAACAHIRRSGERVAGGARGLA